jgi:hypothetical protein
MNRLILIAASMIMLYSCASNTGKQEVPAPVAKDTVVANVSYAGCYEMIINKDSAYMQLADSGYFYSGKLSYKRFEKDSNNGIVTLSKEKDHLSGWYTFQSEGMTSVRQIIFKASDGKLAEGFGEIGVIGDSAFYKYPVTLQFEETHPFIKVNCK